MGFPKSVRPGTGIKGMDIVMSNLNREIKKLEVNSLQGTLEAAVIVRRDMDNTPPLIPIDTGNLRASWFTVAGLRIGKESAGGHKLNFKGKDAGTMEAERALAITEYKAQATALLSQKKLVVFLGFSANYAVFVHEMVDANFAGDESKIKRTKKGKVTQETKKYTRRAGAGAKFFEAALKRNAPIILQTIGKKARIK